MCHENFKTWGTSYFYTELLKINCSEGYGVENSIEMDLSTSHLVQFCSFFGVSSLTPSTHNSCHYAFMLYFIGMVLYLGAQVIIPFANHISQ